MADKTISVEITGDASGLVSAAERAKGALSGISGVQTGTGIAAQKNVEIVKQTEREIKNLESGLKRQKDTTLQYTKSLRESAATFKEKKTAVQEAAIAYKSNSASIKENDEYLRYQLKLLDGTVSTNKEHIASLQSSNKYLKRNSDEYKTNRSEIKSLQAENKRLADDRKALSISILDNEKALKSETDKYKTAQIEVKKAAAEYKGIKSNLKQSQKAETEYAESIAKTNKQLSERKAAAADAAKGIESAKNSAEASIKNTSLKETGARWRETGEAIDKVTKPLQVVAVGTAAIGAASAKAAISFEDNFASVKKTVEGTPEQLEKVKRGIIDMTTVGVNGHGAIPQTTAQLTELAASGGQLGIATDNIVEFTEVMAEMNTATNLYGAEGAAVLARFMNVTNTSQDKVRNLGSSIVDLGNNFATTEAEIASLALRMGETGGVVRISAQDILGYATALSSMGIEAEAGGSAVSRIWMDIQKAVAGGGKDLAAIAKVSKKSSKDFAQHWKKDASGAFRDFIKGLSEAKDQISVLEDLGFKNIRDITALQALAGPKGIDLMTDALERSNKAWAENTALQKEADAKANTTAGKIQIAKNNVTEAARSLGEVMLPTIVDVTGKVSGFTQKLAGMSDAQKKSIVSTGATVVEMGLLVKGTAGAIKTIGTIGTGISTVGAAASAAAPAIASIAPPVAAALAVVLGLHIGVKKLNQAMDEAVYSRNHFAEEVKAAGETFKNDAEAAQNTRKLADEFKSLQSAISNGDYAGDELENARARLAEIADYFDRNYEIKLVVDSADVKDAADNTKKLDNAVNDADNKKQSSYVDLYGSIIEGAGDYSTSKDRYNDEINRGKQMDGYVEKCKTAVTWLEKWKDEYDTIATDSSLSAKEQSDAIEKVNSKYRDFMRDSGVEQYASLAGGGKKIDDAIASANRDMKGWQDIADEAYEAAETIEQNTSDYATSLSDFYTASFDNIREAAKNGEDYELTMRKLGNVIRDLGLRGDEIADIAIPTAVAQNSFESLTDAVNAGGDALDSVVGDAMGNMDRWGMATNQAAELMESTLTNAGVAADTAVSMINSALEQMGAKGRLEITAEGTVVWKNDTTEPDGYEPENPGTVKFTPDTTAIPDTFYRSGVISFSSVIGDLAKGGKSVSIAARGTDNFPGGLAMVNDQRGVADPRELIVDKGRAFIPNGRDVILPLSKGAKVYTAAETKRIMSGMGIPHYASGKDNSDAFTAARDDYAHYTATHAVTTAEQLEKWVEFSKKFKSNLKDVQDIEEQIYSLTRKNADELNKESKAYVKLQSQFNIWDETGDDPVAAYERVRQRNYAEFEAGRLTWVEYTDAMSEIGEEMYGNRLSQSEKWLEHEEKYNDLSYEDYIAGLSRMSTYTQEYYDRGIIDYATYRENMIEIDEKYLDRYKANLEEARESAVAEYEKSADVYFKVRETFDDWDKVGDSKTRYWTAYLENIERLYREGNLNPQDYADKSMDAYLELYKAFEDSYDKTLQEYEDKMSDVHSEYSELRSKLQSDWDQTDRDNDLDEVNRLIGIYNNAVTDAGQQKYKDLLEQKEQLLRQQELADIEADEAEDIEEIQKSYDAVEKEKERVLDALRTDTFNIFSGVDTLAQDTSDMKQLAAVASQSALGTVAVLQNAISSGGFCDSVLTALNKIASKVGAASTYYNNGTYHIASDQAARDMIERLTGTIVSGLGSVMMG